MKTKHTNLSTQQRKCKLSKNLKIAKKEEFRKFVYDDDDTLTSQDFSPKTDKKEGRSKRDYATNFCIELGRHPCKNLDTNACCVYEVLVWRVSIKEWLYLYVCGVLTLLFIGLEGFLSVCLYVWVSASVEEYNLLAQIYGIVFSWQAEIMILD